MRGKHIARLSAFGVCLVSLTACYNEKISTAAVASQETPALEESLQSQCQSLKAQPNLLQKMIDLRRLHGSFQSAAAQNTLSPTKIEELNTKLRQIVGDIRTVVDNSEYSDAKYIQKRTWNIPLYDVHCEPDESTFRWTEVQWAGRTLEDFNPPVVWNKLPNSGLQMEISMPANALELCLLQSSFWARATIRYQCENSSYWGNLLLRMSTKWEDDDENESKNEY